jgi:tetratricopeptide (TPR) repeat protein
LANIVPGTQNPTEESRTGIEQALKTYRELAKQEPETYLPNVAATLNDLGILDSDENRIEKARREFGEALKIGSSLFSVGSLLGGLCPLSAALRLLKVEANINGILPAGGRDYVREAGLGKSGLFEWEDSTKHFEK